jgi:hypothetical protein
MTPHNPSKKSALAHRRELQINKLISAIPDVTTHAWL